MPQPEMAPVEAEGAKDTDAFAGVGQECALEAEGEQDQA